MNVVKALIEAGANVNAVGVARIEETEKYGPSALITAVKIKQTATRMEMIKVLLDAGADANAGQVGYTALHLGMNRSSFPLILLC